MSELATSTTTPPALLDGGPLLPEPRPSTLGEALVRAATLPGAGSIVYLDGEGRPAEQRYGGLLADALVILRAIRTGVPGRPAAPGPRPGDRVLLQIRAEADLLAAFWACVLGGFVPVPVTTSPPVGSTLTAPELLAGLWEMLGRAWIISDDPVDAAAAHARFRLGDPRALRAAATASQDGTVAGQAPIYPADPDDVAALLLTSGSTGLPKAVMLTHRNIIARAAASARVRGLTSRNRTFNWMPLDHVGGLIMFHARDVWLGCHQVHARIGWVLADPLRWLDAISEHRCDTTWAPNFAFGLVTDHAAQAAGRSWDLRRLTYIMNGGEAVKPRVARAFLNLLAPYGVPPTAMHPGWGMSETSGGVVDCVFDPAQPDQRFTAVGVPHPGLTVRVVSADGTLAPQGTVGMLQASGLPVTAGYDGDSAQNRQSFTPDGWFKTGDLAVIANGLLTVTGRVDDAIAIGPVTCYGHEIEGAIEELDFVEPSYTVVCPLTSGPAGASGGAAAADADSGTALAVFYHPRSGAGSDAERQRVVRHVAERFGLRVAMVRPVRREDVPKTGIGKLKRAQMLKLLASSAIR